MLERTDDPENEFDDAMSLLLSQSAISLMFADDLDGAMRRPGAKAGALDFLVERPVLDRMRIHGIFALVHTQRGARCVWPSSISTRCPRWMFPTVWNGPTSPSPPSWPVPG